MNVSFSSPWAGLVAAAAVVPLAVLAAAELRTRRLRSTLGLAQPRLRGIALAALTVCVVPLLLGVAAAQPMLERSKVRYVRTDAAAFFVLDTSRSMLAAGSPGGRSRFERARDAALQLRAHIGDVPAGIASMTDRLLPHLFPTGSTSAFTTTLERAVGVERPPPERVHRNRATSLYAVSALSTQNYFPDSARRRVAIVFTDGETASFDEGEVARDFQGAHIRPIFVQVWNGDERVFGKGGKSESYRPDPVNASDLSRLARSVGGQAFAEGDLGAAAAAVRAALGDGPRVASGRDDHSVALAPYAAFLAFFPLGVLLWRRNLWGLLDRSRLRSMIAAR
jgi:hypothetical protein